MAMIQHASGMYQCSKCGRYYHKEDLITKEESLYGRIVRTGKACPVCQGIAVLITDRRFSLYN